MELNDFLDAVTKAGKEQLEMEKTMLNDNLDASDRIYLRRNAEALSVAALQVAADPTL